ncbi:glycosyltransferase family 39 protein [Parasulfuritortus cantonensis]|nr:glycosyltransferase family 39 protein [Parasulfuritortus cantonensis]
MTTGVERGGAAPERYAGLAGWLLPLLYFIVLALRLHGHEPFELDGDEGLNLIKAMLVGQGYGLYAEIWSDQPPVFTLLLSTVFDCFGPSVYVGRLTVLAFAALLLWAAWRFLAALAGRACGHLGVALICVLPYFTRLSVSIMIGLPALALAMLALAALVGWHRRRSRTALALSAGLLALSVGTKAFTVVLVPVIVFVLILAERPGSAGFGARLRPALVWLALFGLVGAVIFAASVTGEGYGQLSAGHVQARTLAAFRDFSFLAEVGRYRIVPVLFALAVLGTVLGWRRGDQLVLYPAGWLACALIALSGHAPVWDHLTLLATLPAALLAAYAVTLAARAGHAGLVAKGVPRGMAGAAVAVTLLLVGTLAYSSARLQKSYPFRTRDTAVTAAQAALVAQLSGYAGRVRWLYTDRPMYAFRAGLAVPPPLAVVSWKRLQTGGLTGTEVARALAVWRPELILLERFAWPDLDAYLVGHYRRLPGPARLYRRADLE